MTGAPSFRTLLSRVKAAMSSALGNADVPFPEVVQAANIPRSSAYPPVFQVMCTVADAMFIQSAAMEGLSTGRVEVKPRSAATC